jgi:hypothetical protein
MDIEESTEEVESSLLEEGIRGRKKYCTVSVYHYILVENTEDVVLLLW